MPSKHNLNVSLTEHLCAFIEAQVASGRFRARAKWCGRACDCWSGTWHSRRPPAAT